MDFIYVNKYPLKIKKQNKISCHYAIMPYNYLKILEEVTSARIIKAIYLKVNVISINTEMVHGKS